MTYIELLEKNKKLTEAINVVLRLTPGGTIETAQSVLQATLDEIAKTEEPSKFGGTSRLDGEECGDQSCKHSSTFHTGGKGLCTKVDCVCFKFIPTGKANQNVR